MSATREWMRADRACAVAAAAAHDLNEELTVILSSVTVALLSIDREHPARPMLLNMQLAAQRCAWKVSGLLNFTARWGARGNSSTMERAIDEDGLRLG